MKRFKTRWRQNATPMNNLQLVENGLFSSKLQKEQREIDQERLESAISLQTVTCERNALEKELAESKHRVSRLENRVALLENAIRQERGMAEKIVPLVEKPVVVDLQKAKEILQEFKDKVKQITSSHCLDEKTLRQRPVRVEDIDVCML